MITKNLVVEIQPIKLNPECVYYVCVWLMVGWSSQNRIFKTYIGFFCCNLKVRFVLQNIFRSKFRRTSLIYGRNMIENQSLRYNHYIIWGRTQSFRFEHFSRFLLPSTRQLLVVKVAVEQFLSSEEFEKQQKCHKVLSKQFHNNNFAK